MNRFVVSVFLFFTCSAVMATDMTPLVLTVKPLLLQALNSFGGKAQGKLSGEHSKFLKATTNMDAEILVFVSTAFRYKQKGCSRLHLEFKLNDKPPPATAKVANKPVKSINQSIQMPWVEMNYCTNGLAPKSLEKEAS